MLFSPSYRSMVKDGHTVARLDLEPRGARNPVQRPPPSLVGALSSFKRPRTPTPSLDLGRTRATIQMAPKCVFLYGLTFLEDSQRLLLPKKI